MIASWMVAFDVGIGLIFCCVSNYKVYIHTASVADNSGHCTA